MRLDWLRDPSKKSAAMGAAIFAAGLLVANAFVLSPLARQNAALKETLRQGREKHDVLEAAAALDARLKKHEGIFADSRSARWLMTAVKNSADQSGVRLLSVTPQNIEPHGRFWKIPVLIEAECGYHELGRFAASLESLPKLVKIDRLRAEAPQRAPADASTTAHVTLSVSAFYPDPKVT